MHVLIQTAGSSGDVHPFIGLGRALAARGHEVDVIANEAFGPLVRAAGLGLVPFGTHADYERLKADPELWHPRKGTQFVFERAVIPYLRPATELIRATVRPGETLLVTSTLGFSARLAAEVDDVPLVTAHLAPSCFRSIHRMPQLGGIVIPDWWPRLLRRGFWWLGDRIIDRSICTGLNALRAELGLAPVARPFADWVHRGDGLLGLFPPWFGPPQPDWPAGIACTGFPLFDDGELGEGTEYGELSPELADWMADGEPPLLFTHGSANVHASSFFAAAAEAARELDHRALLVSVNPAAVPRHLPDGVRAERVVPFSKAFPRCAVVVHHGGIGTTARGLAAAVPQLVVPMAFDQFDNGSRLEDLGVGRMLPASRFTGARAAALLGDLLTDERARSEAARIATKLDADAARTAACDAIERVARARLRAPSVARR